MKKKKKEKKEEGVWKKEQKKDASSNQHPSFLKGIGGRFTLRVDRLLAGQLLEHLASSGDSIASLADTAVHDQLVDLNVPHRVLSGFGSLQRNQSNSSRE